MSNPYYPTGDVVREDGTELVDLDGLQLGPDEHGADDAEAPKPRRKGKKRKKKPVEQIQPVEQTPPAQIAAEAAAATAEIAAQKDRARALAAQRYQVIDQAIRIVRALPMPDDLPSENDIATAVLLANQDLLDRCAGMTTNDAAALARNSIVSVQDCDTTLLDAAAAAGRLILLVLPRQGSEQSLSYSAVEDSMPNSLLAWHAETGAKVGVIRDRHAVWVQRQVRQRLSMYEVLCPAFARSIELERQDDQQLWLSGRGVAEWLARGHVEWLPVERSRVAHEQRVAEHAKELVEQRREFNRRVRTRPSLVSPFEVLRMNRGGVSFFVEGLLADESLNALIGPPENGKSKFSCALAAATAVGKTICGRRINRGEPCRVLYIARERLVMVAADILANCDDESERQLVTKNLSLTSFAPKLDGSSGMSLQQWASEIRATDAKLIIVDTYTAMLAANGVDEISGAGAVLEAFRDVIAETGAVVLFVGHARKSGDGDERGQALREAADTMLPVTKHREGEGELVVRIGLASKHAKHSNHARPTHDLLVTFRAAEGGGMRLDSSAEVASVRPDAVAKARNETKPSAADTVLAVLTKEPQSHAVIHKASGTPKSTLSTALAKLVRGGLAVCEETSEGKSWRLIQP